MQHTLTQKPLNHHIPWHIRFSLLRNISLILLGSLLIAIGAKIIVPLEPVPVTLGSLAVLFIGMTYGFRLGMMTVLTYLIAGIAGLPVFSITHLGITAGYLFGYILAVTLTGFLAEHGWARHIFSTITATLLGTLLILFCGWICLSQLMSASTAFDVGIKPFLLGDSLKIIFLAAVVPSFWGSAK